ncbi:MAG: hypothetical protein ABH867_01595 [Patescibacteria group bacterium]
MRQKIILSFLVAILVFGTSFGGWAARDTKVREQAGIIDSFEEKVGLLESQIEQSEDEFAQLKGRLVLTFKERKQLIERIQELIGQRDGAEKEVGVLISDLNKAYNDLNDLKNETREAVELAEEEGRKAGFQSGYEKGYQKDRPRNPTYSEVQEIIRGLSVSLFPGSSCVTLTADFINLMREDEIRTGAVFIFCWEVGHAIVAFDTPDKGLVYLDWTPMTKGGNVFVMREVKVELNKRYFRENNLTSPRFNDTVYGVSIIW